MDSMGRTLSSGVMAEPLGTPHAAESCPRFCGALTGAQPLFLPDGPQAAPAHQTWWSPHSSCHSRETGALWDTPAPHAALLQPVPGSWETREWGPRGQQAPGVARPGRQLGRGPSSPGLQSLRGISGVGLDDCTHKVPGPGQPGETACFFPAMLPVGHGSSRDAQASWQSTCRAGRPWGAAPPAGRGRCCSPGALGPGPLLPAPLGARPDWLLPLPPQVPGPVGVRPTPGPASGPHPVSTGPKQPPATRLWPEAAAHGAPQPRAAAPVLLCAMWGPSTRLGKTPGACSGLAFAAAFSHTRCCSQSCAHCLGRRTQCRGHCPGDTAGSGPRGPCS